MEKRGISSVITTLVIIFIAIAFVVLIWTYIRPVLLNEGETFRLRSDLTQENFEIRRLNIDEDSTYDNPNTGEVETDPAVEISLVVQKKSGTLVEGDILLELPEAQDIVTVVDVSGSMFSCNGITNTQCVNTWDPYYTWNSNKNSCRSFKTPTDASEQTVETQCLNLGGEIQNGIKKARDSQQALINRIFSEELQEVDMRLAVIAFGTISMTSELEPGKSFASRTDKSAIADIVNNNIRTINVLSSETKGPGALGTGTCMCGGLNRAIDIINTESPIEKSKTVILMSDGGQYNGCYNTLEKEEGYCDESTVGGADPAGLLEAYTELSQINGVTIHTIGFQEDADESTLKKIAQVGGGQYFKANEAEELISIYESIAQSSTRTINIASSLLFLIKYKDGTTSSIKEQIKETKIYETGSYSIYLDPADYNDRGGVSSIEIYPIGKTSTGKEVVGTLLDSYRI